MIKFLKRWWAYVTTGANQKLEEHADPKIQLQQAMNEAQAQHVQLKQHAVYVMSQQKMAESRLNRLLDDLQNVNRNTQQALLMSAEATKNGDTAKAAGFDQTASELANRIVQLETDVDEQKTMVLQATQASDQAKAAVEQNSEELRRKLVDQQRLLTQLQQAEMQETMNKAMASLSETVGQDVPTMDEVRNKIEARLARAQSTAELQGQSVSSRMAEVEQASRSTAGQARLSEIRAQLGLDPATGTTATPAAAATPEVAAAPTPDVIPVAEPTQQPTPGV